MAVVNGTHQAGDHGHLAAVFCQQRQRALRHQEGGDGVDVKDLPHHVHVDFFHRGPSTIGDAGVVDEHVKRGVDRCHHGFHRFFVSDIKLMLVELRAGKAFKTVL